MDVPSEVEGRPSGKLDHHLVLLALITLPDHCAKNIDELARQIGADKLELLVWGRGDIKLARLLASKVCS
jgi:hypothetical protein